MKRTLKNIVMSVLFLALLTTAVFGTSRLLERKDAYEKYKPFYDSDTNYDVIFMGTSHMLNSIFPQELWKKYGIASYNWAYSNCSPAESYWLIQQITDYTSPQLVVLDLCGLTEYENLNGNGKYQTGYAEAQHVQFDSLPLSKAKIEGTQDVFDDYAHKEDFLWDFILYHSRWDKLTKDDFRPAVTTEKGAELLVGRGGGIQYEEVPATEKEAVDTVGYQYLKKFLEYCSSSHIPVLCVYLPYTADEDAQKLANWAGDTVESYENCSYLNLLNAGLIDFDTDIYKDNTHLNYMGGMKVTDWLGRYLQENFQIPDHSEDAAYKAWNADYERYVDYKAEQFGTYRELLEKMELLYGDDFTAEITADPDSGILDDAVVSNYLHQLSGNIALKKENNLTWNGQAANLILTVKKRKSGEETGTWGYSYWAGGIYPLQ